MNKSVKSLVIALSLVLCVSLLPGCGLFNRTVSNPDANTTTSNQNPAGKQLGTMPSPSDPDSDDPTDPTATSKGGTLKASDGPYSFTFELDGKTYALPTSFAEFAADGWQIQSDPVFGGKEKRLNPDAFSTNTIQKGDYQVSLSFTNTNKDAQALPQCQVYAIHLYEFHGENPVSLIFPGGITKGSSKKELLKLYGEPSEITKYNLDSVYEYSLDYFATLSLGIDNSTGLITVLEMENKSTWETSKPYKGKTPTVVTSYKAPTALGKSWDSGIVRFGGDLYQLPVPVSALVDNGWIAASDPNQMLAAGESLKPFIIRTGNQTLHTSITNYADTPQPAINCFITYLEQGDFRGNIPLELSGGLSLKSSLNDFKKACGEPSYSDSSATTTYFTWGDDTKDLTVYVDKKTEALTNITVAFFPKGM